MPDLTQGQLHGPWQRIEIHLRYGWTVAAEQVPLPDGSVEWGVAALHDGERVFPLGQNLHRTPDAEMHRIERVIDAPRLREAA